MTPSQELIEAVKRFEGLRLKAYKCPAGVWTIGYGHTKGVKQGMAINESAAIAYLVSDLAEAGMQAEKAAGVFLTQGQWDALADFTFNLGIGNLRTSTLLKKVRAGARDAEVQTELRKWVYAGKKKLAGLVKRREWEAARWAARMIIVIACLTGCASSRHTTTDVKVVTLHDTVAITRTQVDTLIKRDSVYLREWLKGDTVFRTEYREKTIYKPSYRTDSIYIMKQDTVTVDVVKEVPAELTKWQKFRLILADLLMCFIMFTGMFCLYRLYLKIRPNV